jgi:hypothetical protein
VLTDADWSDNARSRVGATPSLTASGLVGARLRLATLLHLLFELEAGDSLPLVLQGRPPFERAAARAAHAQAAVGVVFEY